MKKLLAFFLVINFAQLNAQTDASEPCKCCTEKHQEFDFWVGQWNVYDVNGTKVGSNTITKLYDNCVLREEWVSNSPNRGTSNNYYNATDKTWNQVWVDNSGYSLVLKGGLVDSKMVLKSELLQGKKGKYYNQISWTPNEDGSVTQLWELFKEDGSLIQEAFRGIYKKE